MIEAVGIVVPAKDEEQSIEACISSLESARAQVPSHVDTFLVLVLDACTDQTRARAHAVLRQPHAVVDVDYLNVGESRAHGMREALRHFSQRDPARVWLVTTDADSHVSRRWLADHVAAADAGADAIAGTIRISDWTGFSRAQASAFDAFYRAHGNSQAHGHVHGSNLGFRADAYLRAGGFSPLRSGEDHALWNALRRQGARMVSSRDVVVTTSSRLHGRAPDGFAQFLMSLGQDLT